MRLRSEGPREEPKRPSKKLPETTARVPHDPINEQALIAAAMADPEVRAKLVKVLPADGFYAKGHAALWAAVVELERRKLACDPAALKQVAPDVDLAYARTLAASRPSKANLAFHVECFLWDRVRVEAVKGPISALLDALSDPSSDQEKVRALGAAVGRAFAGRAGLRYLRDGEQVQAEAERRVRRRMEGIAVYPYGIEGLDAYEDGRPRMVPAMEPGQVTLVMGLSGAGKTTVTNQIVLAQVRRERKVLHGAWEQDAEANLESLAAFDLGLDRERLRTGKISPAEFEALREAMGEIRQFVRFFDLPFDQEHGGKRVLNSTNLDVVHAHVEGAGCDVCVFDLWKRSLTETDPNDEERALWRQLAIAKATRTHHVLVHHLRGKDVEQRQDKRPTREAIKGSGAWVDVPDTIIGVHRPALWKNVPDDKLELFVLKQRYGKWPLAVEFDHDPATGIISGGRTIEYEQPGDRGPVDSFLDEPTKKSGRRR
jgi:replicative DNA helicase